MNAFGLALYLAYTFGWIPICLFLLIKRAKGYVLVSTITSGVILFGNLNMMIRIEPSPLPILNATLAGVLFIISLIIQKVSTVRSKKKI